MTVSIVCAALLGLLVFGLGLNVSLTRQRSRTGVGFPPDPADPLHKACRAHANAAEYAPMMAVLILLIASREPAAWMIWTAVAATVSRYLHAMGMLLSPTLADAHPLRFAGALGTYVTGLLLVLATFMVV